MNRSTRTVLVVAIAVLLATGATYLVYRTIQRQAPEEVEVAHAFAVVAAHQLPLGSKLAALDLKLVPWPVANPVQGGFSTIEDAVGRGLIAAVAENEPLTVNNVASKEAGVGLPPTIPPGMRAISVKVNEVIGVAGFVVQGTRVDVMAIVKEGGGSMARVVVSNVQVLAAGTNYNQDVTKDGKAIPSSVVTLMVTPEDAQLVGLAATEGQILLTLRNPLDTSITPTLGTRTSSLAGQPAPAVATPVTTSRPRAQAPPPVVAPPPPPKPFSVEVIRAAKRTEEIIK